MAIVKIFIQPLKLGNTNSNNAIQWPSVQEHSQFFTDCQDAYNSRTNPSILLRFSRKHLRPAIVLCYALYRMKLYPLEALSNEISLETIITCRHNHPTALNGTADALKIEIKNLIANLGFDYAFMQDLIIQIKECTAESSLGDDTDGLSSSSGISSEHIETMPQIAVTLELSDNNRFFPACKKCYNLKPPIIIQQSGNECSWCKSDETILLHEMKNVVDDILFVEYSIIRKFCEDSILDICQNNLSGQGTCSDGNDCTYAHSPDEKRLWQYMTDNGFGWKQFGVELSKDFLQDDTMAGCFHCPICSENFSSGSTFSAHCDSPQHRQLSRCLDVNRQKWKYRQPPNLKGNFRICVHIEKGRECNHGDACDNAHSAEELSEWNKRFSVIKEKLNFAKENQLLSFAEQISQEFEENRNSASVLTESIEEVSCKVRPCFFRRCPTDQSVEWMVRLNCQDTHQKLSHVALLQRDGNDYFKVCKVRGKRQGQFTSHINYTASADDVNSMMHGIAKFKVKFQSPKPGKFAEVLVFEFLKNPRPALMVKFHVSVGDKISISQERPKMPDSNSWEKRQIVPFAVEIHNEFEKTMQQLINKYKPREVALEYVSDDSDADLDSKSLTKENYVSEMHRFLYREEAARKQAISKVYCSCKIGLSDNYFSTSGGLCFVDGKGGLFGIFQLPGYLNRDTDEGLLVLENCQMVLLSRKNSDQSSTVYEARLESKAADHAVLSISKRCVEDWKLRSGLLIECDLQFQLDRRLFCMSHCALDQLPELDRLSIVCPDPPSSDLTHPANSNANCRELDPQQIRVLQHLIKDRVTYPLFAVVGPFGTGKTYTISQCVLFLLRHYTQAKILVCTHSNSAADLYIQNNFRGDEWDGKIIRVYYHDRIIKSVPPEVRRFCVMDEHHTTFRYPTTKEILSDKVRVVITTFATALVLGLKATGLHGVFTHIFLDEAAQAMECEAIIPLTLASTDRTKVIVAGDHMQISQKVYSKKFGSEADYTLVERMYKRYKTFNNSAHDQLFVFLTRNYRCVEPILNLIQEVFYKRGILKACTKEKPVAGLLPVQFYHIQGNCQKDFSSGGFFNLDEAELAVYVVKDLLQQYFIQETDIVVVSSYSVQVKHMRSLFRKEGYRSVNVNRVRDIQGQEYKVVIMCGVHCRKSATDENGSKTGLLADVGLLNTAITRSKVAVIAIGDAVTLCSLGLCHLRWHKFVETCALWGSLLPRYETFNNILFQVNRLSKLNPEAQGFVPRKKKISQKSNSLRNSDSPSSNRSSPNSNQPSEEDPGQEEDGFSESDEDETSEDDPLALVDDKILDDILERQLGYRPDKAVVKVDQYGLEYLDALETDPNEPGPNLRHHGERRTVIHEKFTVGQLLRLLRDNPEEYKHCFLSMMSWHSAEAILKEPEGDLIKISLDTRRSIGRAFNKDEVVVRVSKNRGKVVTGRVIGILQRYKEPRLREFVCIPDEHNPAFLCPVDYKVTKFAFIRRRGTPDYRIPIYKPVEDDLKFLRYENIDRYAYNRGGGKLFIVRYLRWSEYSPYPLGYVSKVIAASDAESYIAITYDRPAEHKQDMEKQCQSLEDQNKDLRKDCTGLYTFTIDPPGSKDLDDALSIEKCTAHSNCYQIGIHIADVASVVPAQSKVDKEARSRATTFYDPDVMKDRRKNSPMLPRHLSSDKCSLLADGKAKPAISTFFHTSQPLDILDPDFKVPAPKLTTIKSSKQMTYREAENLLRRARRDPEDANLLEINENTLGQQLYQIWQYVMGLRVSRLGTAVYHHEINSNKLQEFFDEGPAHMLIEEAMITLNACTAIFLKKRRCNFLLRCQDPPLEEEWRDWMFRYDSQIQLSLSLKSRVNYLNQQLPEDLPTPRHDLHVLPELLVCIKEALQEGDLDLALMLFSCDGLQPSICPANDGLIGIQKRATLKEASRVDENLPSSHSHFSLRLPFYSWCSSPIRRYTDIIAQRQIIKICKKSNQPARRDDVIVLEEMSQEKGLNETCKQLSLRQNDAKDYERELMQFTLAKLFQDQQERSYQQAVVTEITNKEIKFSLVSYSNLRRISILPYTHLFARKAIWGEQVNTKFCRPGEKILKSNHLFWYIRYYDLRDKSEGKGFKHSHFQHSTVPAQRVKDFVGYLSTVITSGTVMGETTSNEIKAHLKRIVAKQKPTQRCPAKASNQLGPCDGRKCDHKDSKCDDHMSYRTKNDIRHVRVISTFVESGLPILVQLNPRIRRGMLEPTVQLLCLADDFDLCLSHQTDAVETFASDVRPTHVQGKNETMTMKQYANVWLPVLRLDGVYCAVVDGFSITFNGVNIHWTRPGEAGYFTLKTMYCKERMIHMHRDGFLCIRVKNVLSNDNESRYAWVAHALIVAVEEDRENVTNLTTVSFILCRSILSKVESTDPIYKSETLATVEYIPLHVPHRRMAKSLQSIRKGSSPKENTEIAEMLCTGDIARINELKYNPDVERIIQSVGSEEVRGFKFPLNNEQKGQVQRAMGNKLTLVQGPPGTGKSFMGAYMVHYFRQMNIATGNEGFILYCGPSNKSVDVVAEYLMKTGMKILRVYGKLMEEQDYPNPLNPSIKKENEPNPSGKLESITLHKIIRNETNSKHRKLRDYDKKFKDKTPPVTLREYLEYKATVQAAKEEELSRHDVIICTCTGSAMKIFKRKLKSKYPKLKRMLFSHCIIDEAGMCSEPETLVPVVTSLADQVVLIGDQKQLQPVIQCDRARDFGMGVSMFERLEEHTEMLTLQYRMNESICDFPSSHFYNSSLKTDDSVHDRDHRKPGVLFHPSPGNTAVFAHVESEEDNSFNKLEHGGVNSKYNKGQARAVIKILVWLHLTKRVPLEDIMVLSPYKAQCSEISSMIRAERAGLSGVNIGTVVTSQGSERDYVILSTVRSQPQELMDESATLHWRRKYLGFVTDPHQINVAITRARRGLCIIGNSHTLDKDTETWHELLQNYYQKGSVVDFYSHNAPWNSL